MLHEVIMPVLGMTQDTGVICKWHKNVGETVGTGEILMEIETDKTVMEIEAQHTGIIKEIKRQPGIEIPVGEVVAVIESGEAEVEIHTFPDTAKATEKEENHILYDAEISNDYDEVKTVPAKAAKETTLKKKYYTEKGVGNINLFQQQFFQKETGDISSRKVLASPKAKAKAREHGIELIDLRNVPGISEPFHYQDIENAIHVIKSNAKAGQYSVSAEFNIMKFNDLLQWSNNILDSSISSTDLWAVLCTSAFRINSNISTINNSISLKVSKLTKTGINVYFVTDADLGGLGTINSRKVDSGIKHQLHLIDISELNLSSFSVYSNDHSKPLINIASADTAKAIANNNERIRLTMDFQAVLFTPEKAAAFVNEIASLISQPLRLLL